MRKASPKAVGNFTERLLNQGKYRRLITDRFFRATVSSVVGSGPYFCGLIRNDGSDSSDGGQYLALVPVAVGNDVLCVWVDSANAVVVGNLSAAAPGPFKFFDLQPITTTQTNIVVGPIPPGFRKLVIDFNGACTVVAINARLEMSVDGAAVHDYTHAWLSGAVGAWSSEQGNAVAIGRIGFISGTTAPANAGTYARVECVGYDSTLFDKVFSGENAFANAYAVSQIFRDVSTVIWHPATPSAVPQITLSCSSGDFAIGTSCQGWLYL